MVQTKRITSYFRDAVAYQKTQQIEITEDSVKINIQPILDGKIDSELCVRLFELHANKPLSAPEELDSDLDETEKQLRTINVFIAARVVNVKSEGGVKHTSEISDLTGVFLVPAVLSEDGCLAPDSEGIPWIPRDFLAPIMDDILIVGSVNTVDLFIASQAKELSDIRDTGSWEKYITFVQAFWKEINETELNNDFIYNFAHGKQPLFLDEFLYIVPDTTISATHHIKKLYEYALTEDEPFNSLYQTITNMEAQKDHPLVSNSISEMQSHSGQMGGNHPLSPSQREAIDHFDTIKEGDILAINGPPGTGKTTLLQSIVADMFVKRALNKDDAPIIVATSTNNQAVTNIIESFAATSGGKHPKGLDRHWVKGKESFATYFPSKRRVENALELEYQITNYRMEHTVSSWESAENKEESKQIAIAFCQKLFGKSGMNLKQCIDSLHQLLVSFDNKRKEMLQLAAKIPFEIEFSSDKLEDTLEELRYEISECRKEDIRCRKRLREWKSFFNKLMLYRIFKFIPAVRSRLKLKISNFKSIAEYNLSDKVLRYSDIENYYSNVLDENRTKSQGYTTAINIVEIALTFSDYEISVFSSEDKVSLALDSINALFDQSIRFYEFWLSIHYYECRWLSGEHETDAEELFKSTYPVMTDKYRRLCMLTPCLVTTFYMLPANFSKHKDKYLYSFIDLLIVDEAGQVSPEIGVSAFLLAKKALVVGDVNQIEPVWSVSRELDIAMAIDRGVVSPTGYSRLEENGLNASTSSLMKVACNACAFSKYGKKGLLLTEHRRCYDELISYCNELVYGGKLEPIRGFSADDKDYPFPTVGTLEHIQVSTSKSDRRKTSRYNLAEAIRIKEWLTANYSAIKTAYEKESESSLIGVITPFKAQADLIKSELRKLSAEIEKNISIGTVHTFQGGERRIVLFSTVYGSEDGCSFLDYKKNLMNVAMSRAKDRFIVFGDKGCLSTSKEQPSGLLREYLKLTN